MLKFRILTVVRLHTLGRIVTMKARVRVFSKVDLWFIAARDGLQ